MWKLVIHQERKYEGFTSNHKIEFEAKEITDITLMVNCLSCLDTNEKTWYEIKEVKEQ